MFSDNLFKSFVQKLVYIFARVVLYSSLPIYIVESTQFIVYSFLKVVITVCEEILVSSAKTPKEQDVETLQISLT